MIQWIKNLFKSKGEVEEEKDILTILRERYNEYGRTKGVIYVSREEIKAYYDILFKLRMDCIPKIGDDYYNDVKIEIYPDILRDEKLSQLGL